MTVVASSRDRLGCRATDLARDEEVALADITFLRKTSASESPVKVETPPSGQGLVLGMSLGESHWRDIRIGKAAHRHHFQRNSLYLRDFEIAYRAELGGQFDFLLVEIPWNRFLPQDDTGPRVMPRRIDFETGVTDPTVTHLLSAIQPMLSGQLPADQLFIDQVAEALVTYLRHRYAAIRIPACRRERTPSPLIRQALEILRDSLDGNVSLDDIARRCNVSRSHFYQVFRQELGCTPHEWLMRIRVEQARSLLRRPELTLAEIAGRCGFSDQSHFTRSFNRRFGMSPGRWRTEYGGAATA